jgi:hypothetical protein
VTDNIICDHIKRLEFLTLIFVTFQKAVVSDEKVRAKTPNVPRRITSPVITSPRKAASPGFHLQSNGYNNNNNNYSYLIKPSAVRPGAK